jgi:hypothetical protein
MHNNDGVFPFDIAPDQAAATCSAGLNGGPPTLSRSRLDSQGFNHIFVKSTYKVQDLAGAEEAGRGIMI